MFLLVTASACIVGWVVYSTRWIRLRHEWLDSPPTVYLHINRTTRAPWLLVPFGERGWEVISMRFCSWDEPEPTLSEKEMAEFRRLKELFPEAVVSTTRLDGGADRSNKLRIIE
jgi:hypothetical protein